MPITSIGACTRCCRHEQACARSIMDRQCPRPKTAHTAASKHIRHPSAPQRAHGANGAPTSKNNRFGRANIGGPLAVIGQHRTRFVLRQAADLLLDKSWVCTRPVAMRMHASGRARSYRLLPLAFMDWLLLPAMLLPARLHDVAYSLLGEMSPGVAFNDDALALRLRFEQGRQTRLRAFICA